MRRYRTSNRNTAVRKNAEAAGFRSGFEQRVAEALTALGVEFEYEPKDRVIEYKVEETRKYLPDFVIGDMVIECKGRLTADDRKKLLLIKKQQWPEVDLRLVFMYPNNKLSAKSKTRYWEWAEKHGFPWADKEVPKEWLSEM